MVGKIIKGIAGFYYVYVTGAGNYECKAKGVFRKDKKKPLVGDSVRIDILDENTKKGNIVEIFSRKNELIRPAVSNVDQALVIFAVERPKPNFGLLDRFLIMMNRQRIHTIICFNKNDFGDNQEEEKLTRIYRNCGCEVLFTSAVNESGMQELKERLRGKITVVAGPSGVGKSSMINLLCPMAHMETGEISHKIDRGKHTTRHSELLRIEEETFIVDTPGFSALYVQDFEKEELKNYFEEFHEYEGQCRFQGCMHLMEPGCMVKDAVESKKIHAMRYQSYKDLYEEMKEKRKY